MRSRIRSPLLKINLLFGIGTVLSSTSTLPFQPCAYRTIALRFLFVILIYRRSFALFPRCEERRAGRTRKNVECFEKAQKRARNVWRFDFTGRAKKTEIVARFVESNRTTVNFFFSRFEFKFSDTRAELKRNELILLQCPKSLDNVHMRHRLGNDIDIAVIIMQHNANFNMPNFLPL